MSRSVATSLQNDLSSGWVTDATGMNFPEKGVVDAENVKFERDGRVVRRLGFKLDPSELTLLPGDENGPFATYEWQGVEQDSLRSFGVQQAGSHVYIYDVTHTLTPDANNPKHIIDLTTHRPAGSTVSIGKCQFATATGELVIVNQACDPLRVEHVKATDTFVEHKYDIKIRDFKGLKTPGVDKSKRMAGTFSPTLDTGNPRVLYNLANNGWRASELRSWDDKRTDLPSQEEYKGEWRNDEKNEFDVSKVKDDLATTKIYGGRFIMDAFNPDRTLALSEGLSGSLTSTTNDVEKTPDLLDGACNARFWHAECHMGLTQAEQINNQLNGSDAYNTAPHLICTSQPWSTNREFKFRVTGHDGNPVRFELYGAKKEGTPQATDWVLTNTMDHTAVIADGGELSMLTRTNSDYNWWYVKVAAGVATVECGGKKMVVAETTSTADPVNFGPLNDLQERTLRRPALVANWSNRMVYAGVYDTEYSTTVYISKSIEDNERDLGRCYQDNDPTNIKNNQMLASDGLAVKIPDAVKITGLIAKDNDLIVLAVNGTWILRGGRDGVDAEKVSVQKISCAPCDSPCSVVLSASQPLWWGGDNIWTLVYNMQFYTYETKSVSKDKINIYLASIPDYNKTLVCGAYDCTRNVIVWLYNDGKELDVPAETYNKLLTLDLDKGAFYRWGNVHANKDHKIVTVATWKQGDRKRDNTFKYTVISTGGKLGYAEESDTTYHDWDKVNFDSFLISAYGTRGSGVRRQTGRYAHIFMDQLIKDEDHLYWTGDVRKQATGDVWGFARPSLFCNAIYDWDMTGSKWTKRQQVYVPRRNGRSTTVRRIKIRGRGRTMQLRFTSDEGHPFSLIGWAIVESGGSNE